MSLPKVSILIPCYNAEKYISQTIQSCIKQDYSNIEIIIVDDGSIDDTLKIALQYESHNIHIYHIINSGACAARNYASKKSTGEYIMYLDGDDYMSPNKISCQVKLALMYNNDTIITCPWVKFTSDINELQLQKSYVYKDYTNSIDLLLDLLNCNMLIISCWLIHRNIIKRCGNWNELLTINQDGEFFARILLMGLPVMFTSECLVY